MNASKLREQIYRVLDEVLETGVPVEIERKGRKLMISVADSSRKLDRLVERPGAVTGNPDDLVTLDWSHEWQP